MEINEKFYDAVLTEGARWLAILYKEKGNLVVEGGWHEPCFMDIARCALSYDVGVYFKMSWWRYVYIKYIKKFKFLKRPPKTNGYDIIPADFLQELCSFFKITPDELRTLHAQYGLYK